MKHIKFIVFTILFSSLGLISNAQITDSKDTSNCATVAVGKSKISFDIGADLVSRYVWRGTQYGGNGPSIQPSACLTWGGFSAGFWGAYSTNGTNSSQELDFYASYTFLNDMVTIGFTDYFFTNDSLHEDPLNFKQNNTGHIFEPSLAFNGTDKIPFRLLLAANVFGHDNSRINNDPNSANFNTSDGIQYSSYAEIGYFTTFKEMSFDVFAGFNLTAPRSEDTKIISTLDPTMHYMGESGFYGDKMGLVNIGFTIGKELSITDKYSLPLTASVIVNPMANDYYFVFGLSF